MNREISLQVSTAVSQYYALKDEFDDIKAKAKLTGDQQKLIDGVVAESFIKGENMIQLVKPEDLE